MNQEFITALAELAEDKNISKESLLETIEFALITAYKKNYDHAQNVSVTIDKETGEIKVYQQKTIVEEVEDANQEVTLDEAKALVDEYIYFYNNERIQLKTGQTPMEVRYAYAA